MKSLMGYTSNNDVEMQGLTNNLCEGNIEALANRLNEFLVSVSNNLPRLTDDLDVQDEIPAEYVISVMTTENALQQIKVNKAWDQTMCQHGFSGIMQVRLQPL